MSAGEWLVTALVVAFVALKLVEALLFLEAWPLTHVPMFAVRRPPEARPTQLSIHALRAGQWFEVRPWQLGLNRDEVNRRLLRNADPRIGCGELLRAFNRSRPPYLRVEQAYVLRRSLARPGSGASDHETKLPCPLAPGRP